MYNIQYSSQSGRVESSPQRPSLSYASSPQQIASAPQTPRARNHNNPNRRGRRVKQQLFTASSFFGSPSTRKSHSASPPGSCYASGKWSDSPSARSIPLPPESWIEEFSSSGSGSDSDSSTSSCDIPKTVIPSLPSGHIRLSPLQLIQKVMGSPNGKLSKGDRQQLAQ